MNGEAYQFLNDFVNKGLYIAWAQETHEAWRKTKKSQGWAYGPMRDDTKKTNPLMVAFTDLPADIRGQNCLTPYAVVNFFRGCIGRKSLAELDQMLVEIVNGKQSALLEQLGEYVHSHFLAAQLAKGETVETRNDMLSYQNLTEEMKSWDIQLILAAIKQLRNEISR